MSDHFILFSYILNHVRVWVILIKDMFHNEVETKLFYRYEDFFKNINILKNNKIKCINEDFIHDYEVMKDMCIIKFKEEKILEEV